MPRTRSRRDASIAPRGRVSEPRTLARYRREVVALLAVGHGISPLRGLRLVKRWDRYVRARRLEGRPPCNVADHLAKFERERLVSPARRAATKRREGKRKARTRRDAENPRAGEIFETRAGNRWEVIEESGERVKVRRKGNRSEGPFTWSRSALRPLKEIKGERHHAHASAPASPSSESGLSAILGPPPSAFRGGEIVAPDPDGRGRRRGRKPKKAARKTGKGRKLTRKERPKKRVLAKGKGKNAKRFIRRACPRATKVQTLVFSRAVWSLRTAKALVKAHGYRALKVDVTDTSYRFRQHAPSSFKTVGSTPWRKGLTAVFGCPRR